MRYTHQRPENHSNVELAIWKRDYTHAHRLKPSSDFRRKLTESLSDKERTSLQIKISQMRQRGIKWIRGRHEKCRRHRFRSTAKVKFCRSRVTLNFHSMRSREVFWTYQLIEYKSFVILQKRGQRGDVVRSHTTTLIVDTRLMKREE